MKKNVGPVLRVRLPLLPLLLGPIAVAVATVAAAAVALAAVIAGPPSPKRRRIAAAARGIIAIRTQAVARISGGDEVRVGA